MTAFVPNGPDNADAIDAALAAMPNDGGTLYFPAGKYFISRKVAHTLFNGQSSLIIKGDGSGVTQLFWPNARGGIDITCPSMLNAVTVRDMTLSTHTSGTDTALAITNTSGRAPPNNFNTSWRQTLIESITIEGDPRTYAYWDIGIVLNGVSVANFVDIYIEGGDGLIGGEERTSAGTGVLMQGVPAIAQFGVIFNFTRCLFSDLGIGIEIGSFIQGVTVSQCNFIGGTTTAIYSRATSLGENTLLAVSDSQFDAVATQIRLDKGIENVQISNSMFFVKQNQSGILQNRGAYLQVSNCLFVSGTKGGSFGTGISVTNGNQNAAIITGNIFHSLAIGVFIDINSSHVNVQSNSYSSNAQNVLNQGAFNTIGGGSE